MEEWKDIAGYEGLYQVSTLGRVRSFHGRRGATVRILSPRRCTNRYLMVYLAKEGIKVQRLIHRLVAEAFIDNPCKYPQVNHKDEDVTNNQVDNLEWCTAKYNMNYGTHNQRVAEKLKGKKLSAEACAKKSSKMKEWHKTHRNPAQRNVLCVETGEVFESLKSAREFSHSSGISNCLRGKSETSGGYHWRYV